MKRKCGKMYKGILCMLLSTAMSVSVFAMPSDGYGHWAQNTLDKWYNYGYLRGYPDGLLHPNGQITRAEFVTLANSAMGYTGNTYISFSDVPKHFWGYNQISSAVAAGYVSGDRGGKFRPYTPITRQEAAVMLSRMCRLGNNAMAASAYKDSYQMPAWAKGAIGSVKVAGMMSGYRDGTFRPNAPLSRAEAVVLLNHALPYANYTTPTVPTPTVPMPMPMPTPLPVPQTQMPTTNDSYILEDSSLSNRTVTGDLIISSKISSKTVKLDHVKVLGTLRVEGGSTIDARDCDIKHLLMDKKGVEFESAKSRIAHTKFASSGRISGEGFDEVLIDKSFSSRVEIDADVDRLILDEDTDVKLYSDANIDVFEVKKYADRANIVFSNADVDEMEIHSDIRITGKGKIEKMTVYTDGVRSSIKPDRVYTKGDGEEPKYTDDTDVDTDDEDLEDLTADRDKTYRGDYRNVTVTEDGVNLEDMTVYGRLVIDEALRDGGVTLQDVKMKGYTNIKGGGSRSVRFEKCRFDQDIIVNKTRSGDQVVVKFDEDTLKNFDRTVEVEGRGAILKRTNGTGVLPRVQISSSDRVEINLPVKTVEVTKNNSEIVLTEKVDEIKTNQKIKISTSGNGAVEKFSGTGDITINGQPLTKITLSQTELQLAKGESKQLTATVIPAGTPVAWSSDKESVAKVDTNTGNVTAIAQGVAKITAKAGNTIAVCTVTVSESSNPLAQEIQISSTTPLDGGEYAVYAGNTLQLKAAVKPSGASQSVTWESKHTDIATVDGSGKVTAKKAGTATITATAKDGTKVSGSCTVRVEEGPQKVTVAVINNAEAKVESGGTLRLEVKLEPNMQPREVLWFVQSDVSGTTISKDGELKAGILPDQSEKTATVTATVGTVSSEPLEITIVPAGA